MIIDFNGVQYCTTEEEQVNSLFTPGDTLTLLTTKKLKNSVLFYTSEAKGFAIRKHDFLVMQFSKQSNGKIFYQHTIDFEPGKSWEDKTTTARRLLENN